MGLQRGQLVREKCPPTVTPYSNGAPPRGNLALANPASRRVLERYVTRSYQGRSPGQDGRWVKPAGALDGSELFKGQARQTYPCARPSMAVRLLPLPSSSARLCAMTLPNADCNGAGKFDIAVFDIDLGGFHYLLSSGGAAMTSPWSSDPATGTAVRQWRRSSDGVIDQAMVGAATNFPIPATGIQ